MDGFSAGRLGGADWEIDDIPFQDIVYEELRQDPQIFYLLAAASYVESTTALYTDNLVAFFRGDSEINDWLLQQWEPEELRHGASLKRYVKAAWPGFDWNAGYSAFIQEYSRCCRIELLAPTKALELAARCVVETGTSTFYRALSAMTREPVLKRMAAQICFDEVGHYKQFQNFFQHYRASEGTSRRAILRTLWQRMTMVDDEDIFLAFKHVFLVANPGLSFDHEDYAAFRYGVAQLAKQYYPHNMAVRMMLRPLSLNASVARVITPSVTFAARSLFLRE